MLRAATSASIIAEDSTGRISLFSAGASRLLGYRAEEVVGRDLLTVVQEGSAAAGQESRRRKSLAPSEGRQGEQNEYETVYVRKDGLPLHVHVSITPLENMSGKVIGRLHVAQDITPRKLLEAELRRRLERQSRKWRRP